MINASKTYKLLFFLFVFAGLFTACSKDTEEFEEKAVTEPVETKDLSAENFIYRAMSDIYLYKKDVSVLADNYFSSQSDKEKFFENFSTPEELFKDLRAPQDRFSYLIEDHHELNRMAAGTESTTGMTFGLVSYCNSCSEVLGFVKLVLPGSPADEQGVERGMIFNRVDGEQLTKSNFSSLLSSSGFSIGLAKIEGNTISDLDQSISLFEREHTKNPVVVSRSTEIEGNKIGYLFYSSFDDDFDEELNDAIGELKSAGITDLILDLRYNGGGSVRTATDLAAMITGQFAGEIFMKEKWNDKYQTHFENNEPERLLNRFNTTTRNGTALNSLGLNRLFVLTTKSSASASELIINGLDPYIDVIHIGDITTGKFQASVTLYDSPNYSQSSSVKTSHHYALQPLVLKSLNANDVSDYVDGLKPDFQLKEDIRNLGKLGTPEEPLFKTALDIIKGNRVSLPQVKAYPEIGESEMFDPNYQKMYIDNKNLPKLK